MLANKRAIASLSLGQHPSHTLDEKVRVAKRHGYTGLEIVYSDLNTYSTQQRISIQDGAHKIKEICESAGVTVLSLAAFENFEGACSPLQERLATAKHWIDIARLLGAFYLQVPANYIADAICDKNVIVSELQALADLAAAQQPAVSIAYEYMSWSTYCSTWDTALDIVNAVDRANFGLCMDCFHEITKVWASPFDASGKYPNADQKLNDSLRRFVRDCPLEKVFYVQLSDAERFDPLYSKAHPWYTEGEAPQFTWSKHGRPFPLESELGGYTPVVETVKAWVLEKGYKGWISMEVFDRRMRSEAFKVENAGKRAEESWRKVESALKPVVGKL